MSVETRELTGQVVVLTGAGSGIGAATALQLLEAGARLVAGDLAPDRLRGLAEGSPDQVEVVAGDVGEPGTARALIEAGVARWGRVDSVVANAGVGFFGGVLDQDEEQTRLMVTTNYLGTVWLAREAVRHFRTRGEGGDVVVVGSVAGLGPGGGDEAVYAGTKAAQVQFGTSLDREVRGEGIRVAVLAPAAVNTAFAAATGRFGDTPPEEGVFMQPDDIGHAVLTALRQPRRMRTGIWTLWSLAEANG